MSLVTNVILTWPLDGDRDDDIEWLEQHVNSYFASHPGSIQRGLVHADEAGGWYGGSKRLEVNVAVGAFNYLGTDDFLAHLRTLPWPDPEFVQVMIRDQEDDVFHVHFPGRPVLKESDER